MLGAFTVISIWYWRSFSIQPTIFYNITATKKTNMASFLESVSPQIYNFCLIHYFTSLSTFFQSWWQWQVCLCWTSAKQGLMCLAQGHNAVPLVRLKLTTLRSQVKRYYLYIPGSEEELSVEIRFFNNIHISDPHSTSFTTAEPHHSPVLQHFTTNSSSSNLQSSRTFITCCYTHISMKIIVVVLIRRISVPTKWYPGGF